MLQVQSVPWYNKVMINNDNRKPNLIHNKHQKLHPVAISDKFAKTKRKKYDYCDPNKLRLT